MTGQLTYASAAARREVLAKIVREEGYCTVIELAKRLSVSEMTIRRDIARLEDDGQLRSFHGGVGPLAPSALHGSDYTARDTRMNDQKRAIARRAVTYLRPGSGVGIDAGTTGAQLAGLIRAGYQVKVVTQSLPVVAALAVSPGVQLECLGGDFHSESLSFSGPTTLAAIPNVHLDVLFLSASALSDRGAFCGNGFDAITKRAMIDVSDRVILIADSSKFSTSATVRICDWDAIDLVIIDDGLGRQHREMLASRGVSVDMVAIEG